MRADRQAGWHGEAKRVAFREKLQTLCRSTGLLLRGLQCALRIRDGRKINVPNSHLFLLPFFVIQGGTDFEFRSKDRPL